MEQSTMNEVSKANMEVYRKLSIARGKLRSQTLKKSGHNKFAGYNYFELGDFLQPTMEIFDQLGLIGIVSFTKEEASLDIVDVDNGGMITITSPFGSAALKGCHEVQNIGAVETYQRRYLWVTAMEIVEHDALDATTGRKGDATIITPKGGIGDDLPNDVKEFLMELAEGCKELVDNGKAKAAYDLIKSNALEADQEVWLSSQMDSATRAAIKKAKTL
jgi:hypothetical protein